MCLELESLRQGGRALTSFPNTYGPIKKGRENDGEKPAGLSGREPGGKGAGGKGVCFEFRDKGTCRRGGGCWFSHEDAEPVRTSKEEKAAKTHTNAADQSAGAINAQAKGMGKRDGGKGSGKSKDDRDPKDSLCRTIQRGGTCRYGDECKFSHNAEAFNDDGSKRKSRSSQNQSPAKSAITEEE